jgi:hypothetical protein
MGKQTETNKNKSSKKNYSFTGHRVIGENKAKHVSDVDSASDSNTTDDMRKLLESEHSTNRANMMGQPPAPAPAPQNPMMQQMNMMNAHQPMMQPQMNSFMMNQNGPNINQFMGANDIDPLMVNTLAPVNNMKNSFAGMDGAGLMNSNQMAQNMSGIANLAQLGNNNFDMANAYANANAMSETNMMGMNNMGMMNNMMGMNNNMNMMNMNNMGMMDPPSKPIDANSLKNLSNLYSMNIIKQ